MRTLQRRISLAFTIIYTMIPIACMIVPSAVRKGGDALDVSESYRWIAIALGRVITIIILSNFECTVCT